MKLLDTDFTVTMFNTLKEIKDNLEYIYKKWRMRFGRESKQIKYN